MTGRSVRSGSNVSNRSAAKGSLLSLAALACLSPLPVHAQNSGNGLRVVRLAETGPGKFRAYLRPTDDPVRQRAAAANKSAWSVTLKKGKGEVTDVGLADSRGLGVTTVIAVDASGSMRAGGAGSRFRRSLELARGYGTAMGSSDRIALVLFGTETRPSKFHSNAGDFSAEIDAAIQSPPKWTGTRLYASIRTATELAANRKDNEIRLVLVLTDLGEESKGQPREQVEEFAADSGVILHSVPILTSTPRRRKPGKEDPQLTRQDNLKATAEGTGGSEVQGADDKELATKLAALRKDRYGGLVTIDGDFCGMPKEMGEPQGNNTFRATLSDGGNDQWTNDLTFTQPPGEESRQTCPGDKAPKCAHWQAWDADSSKCLAKACATDGECGAGNHCGKDLKCATGKAPGGTPEDLWLYLAGGLGVLLLIILLWLLLRPAKVVELDPEPILIEPVKLAESFKPPTAPKPVPKVDPPAAPERPGRATAIDADDPFAKGPGLEKPLPEVQFEAIGGSIDRGKTYRIIHKETLVGGDPGQNPDILLSSAKVSGRHANIELFPSGNVFVTDLGSSNGTLVNGKKLEANQRTRVSHGDEVAFSTDARMRLVVPGATQSPEPPRPSPQDRPPEGGPSGPDSSDPPKKRPKKQTRVDHDR